MGVFILPIVVGAADHSGAAPGRRERAARCSTARGSGCTSSSLLFAYASFALAGVLGLTYMLQFKEIKKKHLGLPLHAAAVAADARHMNSRAVTIGWLFLTIGVIVGVVWAAQARARAPDDPNLRAMSLDDPKIFVARADVGGVFVRRLRATALGWNGRRAGMAVGGRASRIVLLNFLPISYFVDDEPHVRLTRRCICSC